MYLFQFYTHFIRIISISMICWTVFGSQAQAQNTLKEPLDFNESKQDTRQVEQKKKYT